MILAIDVGNTNTVLGCLKGDHIEFTLRIRSDRDKTADEYLLLIDGLLRNQGVDPASLEGGILSSVVPELRIVMKNAMERLTGKSFLAVGTGIKTGLDIRTDNPAQLGADLVVDAVAALAKYKPPLVIFDMGTATTLSVVDRRGSYLGGMIIPGLRLSVDALSARAAQLPYIHLGAPERLIGTNTVDCMQAGAVYRHAGRPDRPGGRGTGRARHRRGHRRADGYGGALLQAQNFLRRKPDAGRAEPSVPEKRQKEGLAPAAAVKAPIPERKSCPRKTGMPVGGDSFFVMAEGLRIPAFRERPG